MIAGRRGVLCQVSAVNQCLQMSMHRPLGQMHAFGNLRHACPFTVKRDGLENVERGLYRPDAIVVSILRHEPTLAVAYFSLAQSAGFAVRNDIHLTWFSMLRQMLTYWREVLLYGQIRVSPERTKVPRRGQLVSGGEDRRGDVSMAANAVRFVDTT